MEFKERNAIYIQIAERICDQIISGVFSEEQRLPSVRDYSIEVEVNINTLVKSYEYLAQRNIIYNKRGVGYFISPGAVKTIKAMHREEFIGEELYRMFDRMITLGISIEEIGKMFNEYLTSKNS